MSLTDSDPGFVRGQVPTAAQWNSYFAEKVDTVNGDLTNPALWGIVGGNVTVVGSWAYDLSVTFNGGAVLGGPVDFSGTVTVSGEAIINEGTFTTSVNGPVLATGASTARQLSAWFSDTANVKAFGAKGNAQAVTTNCTISSGAAALTVGSALFSSSDVGKAIGIPGAGAASAPLNTTILTYVGPTQVTLAANASTTLSATSQRIVWGADDSDAFQDAVDSLTSGGEVYIPNGQYLLTVSTALPSNIRICGNGPASALVVIPGFVNPDPTFATGVYSVFHNENFAALALTDDNICISNLHFDDTGNPTSGAFHHIALRMVNGVMVSGCSFLYGGDATAFRACKGVLVTGCDGRQFQNACWDFWEESNNVTVTGCYAESDQDGFQFLNFNAVRDNTSTNMTFENGVATGNVFVCTGTGGNIQLEPLGTSSTNQCKNIQFSGNLLQNIAVACRGNVSGVMISGNTFCDPAGTGSALVSYDFFGGGTPSGVSVIGNQFLDYATSSGFGVIRVEAANAVIQGNYVTGTITGATIYTGSAAGVTVFGNTLPSGATITAPQQSVGSGPLYTRNAVRFGTYDNAGSPVDLVVQAIDNNLIFRGTDASGNARTIFSMIQRSSSTALILAVPVQFSSTVAALNGAITVGTNALASDVQVNLNSAAGQTRFNRALTAGSPRWHWGANNTAESGASSGSDYRLSYYNDSGVFQGNAMEVPRATGIPAFPQGIAVTLVSEANSFRFGASGPQQRFGSGSPEGVVTAPVGSTYQRSDGGAGTSVYFKESGAGNTGWVGK